MMSYRSIHVFILSLALAVSAGCAKQVDSKKPLEKIQKEVATMSVQEIEKHAAAYAAAIRAQKVEILKIQEKIRNMPVDKIFNNKAMTAKITGIGREAEALFLRYKIYVKALEEKGGDLSKVQLEPARNP